MNTIKTTNDTLHQITSNEESRTKTSPAAGQLIQELAGSSEDCGDRTLVISEPIAPSMAMGVVRELLSHDAASPGTPIHLQLFSPGGCVVSGLAIIDTIRHLESPVFTYSIGYAASMAAVILACGTSGHRYILPHSRVMIHQSSGSAGGTLDNLRATLAFQSELDIDTNRLLSEVTGRTKEEIVEASRVDNWMSAKAARDFGLVDHILEDRTATARRLQTGHAPL